VDRKKLLFGAALAVAIIVIGVLAYTVLSNSPGGKPVLTASRGADNVTVSYPTGHGPMDVYVDGTMQAVINPGEHVTLPCGERVKVIVRDEAAGVVLGKRLTWRDNTSAEE
jgi:hypothetical protein